MRPLPPASGRRRFQMDLKERLGFPLSAPSHKPGNNPDPCPTEPTHADQRPVYSGNNQCNRVPGRTRGDTISSLSTISSTFHSLFKVLFIFPSRYLFAIGLSPVFSLRWNLPPNWSSIPKELDSAKAPRGATVTRPTGLSPSLVPHSRGLGPRPPQGQRSKDYNSEAEGSGFSSWALPGSLAVTRGILVSFFSSA